MGTKRYWNRSALHLAAENKSSAALEIVKLLLEKGGNPNAVNIDNITPLHLLAKNESEFNSGGNRALPGKRWRS